MRDKTERYAKHPEVSYWGSHWNGSRSLGRTIKHWFETAIGHQALYEFASWRYWQVSHLVHLFTVLKQSEFWHSFGLLLVCFDCLVFCEQNYCSIVLQCCPIRVSLVLWNLTCMWIITYKCNLSWNVCWLKTQIFIIRRQDKELIAIYLLWK
jgi:hypothetical protein